MQTAERLYEIVQETRNNLQPGFPERYEACLAEDTLLMLSHTIRVLAGAARLLRRDMRDDHAR
jgi:hypothetical protein